MARAASALLVVVATVRPAQVWFTSISATSRATGRVVVTTVLEPPPVWSGEVDEVGKVFGGGQLLDPGLHDGKQLWFGTERNIGQRCT